MLETVNDTPYHEGVSRIFFKYFSTLVDHIKNIEDREYSIYYITIDKPSIDITDNIVIQPINNDFEILNDQIHSYCIHCASVVTQPENTECKLCSNDTCNIH